MPLKKPFGRHAVKNSPYEPRTVMKKKKKKIFEELADKHRGRGATPRCPHFGECGGCLFQDIPYEGQLNIKKDYLNSLFENIVTVDNVEPSQPYGYRNRMDMVTAFGKTGLRKRGTYRHVVDIESCAIMQDKNNELYKKIRPLLKEVEDYDYLNHTGYHRYVVLRQARFTGETMANFVLASKENRVSHIIDAIKDDVDSISLLLNDGLADLSYGPVIRDMQKGFITESFDGISYRITPNSFFQSNSEVALTMYRRIKEFVHGHVLDLYSGVGSISLFVASQAESVTGVEQVKEAVDNACINQEDNSIGNVSFICSDAREYMKSCDKRYDTLILDPPRSGMHPKVLKRINAMAPERILYMSCSPGAFRQEIDVLENYAVELFEAYDMFPQTPHVETLALLKRK